MMKENDSEVKKNNDENIINQESNDNILKNQKENDEYKNKINEMENMIKKLKKENEEHKVKINKLEKSISINELETTKKENIILNEENEEYKKSINKLENRIKELENILKEKNEIIDKEKVNNNELNNKINELKIIQNDITEINKRQETEIKNYRKYYNLAPEEQLISIKFISIDQKIDYEVIAKNTEVFSKIEMDLYKIYQEYKNTENYFLMNGTKINSKNNINTKRTRKQIRGNNINIYITK